MRSIKTGHLLYLPLGPISRQMMLASLKLKPEVIISELIVECERQIPGQHIDPGDVEYAKHLSDRGALKISDATAPEYQERICRQSERGG